MKTWNWTRACLLASVIASGTFFFSQGRPSHAEDAKAEKKESEPKGEKAAAPKIDLTPEPGYGTLTGQFVLNGAAPALPPIGTPNDANGGDIKTCGGDVVPSEKLVVDAKTKGIANIFVYLQKAPKIHPKLEKSANPIINFDQKLCQFLPRSLLVRIDQTVHVLSDDPVPHNTHTHPLRNEEKNSAVAPKDRVGANKLTFKVVEKLPIQVGCDIHRWMLSYWLILDHPYAAVTDKEGKFSIGKLPAGDYEFIVWQESVGYIDRKFKVTVPDNGTVDKGTIKVEVAKFKL